MPKVAVYDITGKAVGEIELSDNIFGQEVNANVLHEVVKAYLANQRQGTQSALTRAEVSGGGRGFLLHQKTLASEGHRPRPPGLDPLPAVAAWRRRVRAEAA